MQNIFKKSLTLSLLLLLASLSFSCSNKPADPRSIMLKADQKNLGKTKYSGIEELSKKLGTFFILAGNRELNPKEWSIFTRSEKDKLLVLIKIPDLKRTVKSSRLELIDFIEKIFAKMPEYKNKKYYIAIQGKILWGAVKTPTYQSEKFPLKTSELYKFYELKDPDPAKTPGK